MENTQQGNSELLAELKETLYEQPATVGQRFLNYLVDLIFFYIIVVALTAIAAFIFGDAILQEENAFTMNTLLQYLISYTIYVSYYTFFETLTRGRTIGKMVTKTRAVRNDGSIISFNDSLKRSLVRIIPIEAFSAFGGNPWHDSWTNTKVIREVN